MAEEKPVVRLTGDTKPPNRGRFRGTEEQFKGVARAPDERVSLRRPSNIISYDDYIGAGSFPGGFGPGDRPLSEIPNYEQLTRTERAIMDHLPGADSPIAKVLGKLNEGFLGKVFTVLDSGAEFIERTAGLGAQALAAVGTEESWNEFTHNLRNAWDAGTFAADFTNLPIRENGQIVFNEALPGIEGVINARGRLTELVDGGATHDEALEQVRAEVYEDAGALALRMQLHDAFFHIVGDPLNLFLPRLKIVERGKIFLSNRAQARAIPELVETALRQIDEAEGIVAAAGKVSVSGGEARTVPGRVSSLVDNLGLKIKQVDDLKATGVVFEPGTSAEHAGRANGFFRPSENTIYVKSGLSDTDFVNIVAHEVGEALDHAQGFAAKAGNLSNKAIGELAGTSSPSKISRLRGWFKGTAEQKVDAKEFVVERVRQWLKDPEDFAKKNPNLTAFFEDNIKIPGAGAARISPEVAEGRRAFIKSLPEMTPWDERWLKLSGALDLNGRPGEVLSANELTGLGKTLRSRWNPFGLTPASRAHGLAVNLTDNVIAALAHIDDPEEAVRLVMAAADGTFDPRIAHMVITHEGAMARGLLQGWSAEGQKLVSAWRLTSNQRNIFNFLSSSMGDDGSDLLYRMLKADEMQPIFQKAIDSLGDQGDDFIRMLESAGIDPNISPEKLFEIFEPLAKRGMLNTETFMGRLINEIGDFAAKGAAAKFGVPARGFVSKMADLMKSAESMAFLRINPGYFVRNLVNGEMTMLGRGIFRFLPGRGQKMLSRLGISPTRLRAGFGIAGDVPAHYKTVAGGQEAIKAIDDAILAASRGEANAMTKVADNIRGINLGPFDMGALSAKVESGQSFYATSHGIFEYMAKYHKAPDMSPALVRALGDDRAALLTKAVSGAWNDLEIEDVFLKTDVAMNPRAVLDDASSAFGEDIMRTIPPGEAQGMADDLIEAYRVGGASKMRDVVEEIRTEVTQRYSAALKEATDDISRNIIDQVQHGGIDSALHHHSGMLDEFWGTVHGKYADEFGAVFEQIKNADPVVAGALWDTVRTRTRKFWDDSWSLFEAQNKAITKGLRAWGKDAGNPFPHLDDYGRTFKEWRKGWNGFWKTRDNLIDGWLEARKAGKPIDYSVVKGQIDEAYTAAIGVEDNAFRQLDELMSQYIPEEFRPLYMAGRNEVAGIRQTMREHVSKFQIDPLGDGRAYIDLDAEEQIVAYQKFWQDRKIYLDEIVQAERKHRASMMGDPEALGSYRQVIQNNELTEGTRSVWQRLREEGALPGDKFDVTDLPPIEEGSVRIYRGVAPGTTPAAQWWSGDLAYASGEPFGGVRGGKLFYQDVPQEIWDEAVQEASRVRGATGGRVEATQLEGFIPEEFAGKGVEIGQTYSEDFFDTMLKNAREMWNQGERDLGTIRGFSGDKGMWDAVDEAARAASQEPDDFLRKVLNAPGTGMAPEEGLEFAGQALPDAEGIIGRLMPQDQGLFELWNMKGSKALDAIGESVVNRGKLPPIKLNDLDEAAQAGIRSYVSSAKANLSSSRYQAIKFGEWRRDGALLNYSRRLNYNTWAGTVMPFEFWTTTSIRKWALHTLNRPTMTSLYLRLQDFLEKGYRPEQGLPSRLKGQIRVNAPFLPDFLGDSIFVDPLSLALPFKQWEYAIDTFTQQESQDMGRTRRVMEELLNDGEITEQQYAQALENESGPVWERAISLARLDDTEGRSNLFDFASMLTAPHAPLAWAHNALRGTPEKIGPVLPLTRTVKGVTALLGIGPPGGINIEGNIREHLGLPRFDQWDDYRTNRMLSNMVADGEITVQEAGLAMTSKQGEHYEEAKRRAGIEYGIGALGSTVGIPLKAYPPGEEHLRKLKDDYEAAWVKYEGGDDSALNDFYQENPEYESRQLALEFEPEEQLRKFLMDEIWDRWNDLPIQHKRDVADGLGEVFQTAFLDKETRSTDNISSDMLQAWLQIMGGETPGMAEWDQNLHPIELAPPEIAQRLQAFYLTRQQNFRYNDNIGPLWDTYFALDKAARKTFFRENPIMKQYLDWRNSFMFRNPELARYIEDDPTKLPTYPSEEEFIEVQEAQPDFSWLEWQNVLTIPMWRLVRDNLRYGDSLLDSEVEELQDIAGELGLTEDQLMLRLQASYEEAEGDVLAPQNGNAGAGSGGLQSSRGGQQLSIERVVQKTLEQAEAQIRRLWPELADAAMEQRAKNVSAGKLPADILNGAQENWSVKGFTSPRGAMNEFVSLYNLTESSIKAMLKRGEGLPTFESPLTVQA